VSVIAVVEIDPVAGLVALAVLGVMIVVVGVGAWWLLRHLRPGRDGTSWQLNATTRLPVSKPTLDRVASLADKTLAKPEVPPKTRALFDQLTSSRNTFAVVYRTILILAGLLGVAGAIGLFRQADSANMLGLPASIILLVSLGALLSGLIPSRTVKPIEPLDPALFKNVHVNVSTERITIDQDEARLERSTTTPPDGNTEE
jgi:hypothetical protein